MKKEYFVKHNAVVGAFQATITESGWHTTVGFYDIADDAGKACEIALNILHQQSREFMRSRNASVES